MDRRPGRCRRLQLRPIFTAYQRRAVVFKSAHVDWRRKFQDYTYHMDRTGQWGSANAFFGTVGTAWNDITVQTRLNTPGKKDGFLRIWHNGTKVLDKPMAFVGSELVGYWDALRFLGTIGGTCSTSENYFTQLSYIDYRYHTIITP